MISSFYHLEYSCDEIVSPHPVCTSNGSSFHRSPESLVTHAKMYAAAIKYQADGLRDLTAEKFEDNIEFLWNHEVFAEVVTIVFHSTPDDVAQLRNIVIDTMYSNLETLKNKKDIQAVLSEIPRLAYILLKRKCDEKPFRVLKDTRSSVTEFDYGETRLCLVCDGFPLFWSGSDVDICRDCWEARSRWD